MRLHTIRHSSSPHAQPRRYGEEHLPTAFAIRLHTLANSRVSPNLRWPRFVCSHAHRRPLGMLSHQYTDRYIAVHRCPEQKLLLIKAATKTASDSLARFLNLAPQALSVGYKIQFFDQVLGSHRTPAT